MVITNKPNPYSRAILEGLGVASFFSDIIGGDSEYPKKPDPAALVAVMGQAGITVHEVLFIGDSPVDIEAGRRAGVLTIAVAHGLSDERELQAASPDVAVRDFAELLQLAQRHGW